MPILTAVSSSCRLRHRYLSRLGILPPCPGTGTPKLNKESLLMGSKRFAEEEQHRTSVHEDRSLREEVPEISLRGLEFLDSRSLSSLTYDDSDDDSEHTFYNEDEGEESLGDEKEELRWEAKNNRVHFHKAVAVYEIPSHREYDEISHKKMWLSLCDLESSARRNTLEFWADGKDWRNACEETDMIQTRRGELVHPATWKLICEHVARQAPSSPKERRRRKPPNNNEFRKRLVCVGSPPSLTRFADT